MQNLAQAMVGLIRDDSDGAAVDPSLRIWLLTIGAIEERSSLSSSHEEGRFFHRWLEIELAGYGITSLSDYKRLLSEIMWSDVLFDERLNSLVDDMGVEFNSICV
jgi:hypothetical protein